MATTLEFNNDIINIL